MSKICFVWTSKYVAILEKLEKLKNPNNTQRAAIAILKITGDGTLPSADDVIRFMFDGETPDKSDLPKWRGVVGRAVTSLRQNDPAHSLNL